MATVVSTPVLRGLLAAAAIFPLVQLRAAPASGGGQDGPPRVAPLEIRVVGDGWGDAPSANIEKVCASAAGELWRYFPARRLSPIRVSRSREGPIVLYDRLPGGEYQVRLDAEGTHWAQFSFQFAHEFCHILGNYRSGPQPNKWFEEAVCETASLFALRNMARTWQSSPPYPNWKEYAPHLKEYADKRLQEAHLPAGATLAEWYRRNAPQLRSNSCRRELNRVVAAALLPLLEREPQRWEAVGYLNVGKGFPGQSFRQYMNDWEYYVPERHKEFVRRIGQLFEPGRASD